MVFLKVSWTSFSVSRTRITWVVNISEESAYNYATLLFYSIVGFLDFEFAASNLVFLKVSWTPPPPSQGLSPGLFLGSHRPASAPRLSGAFYTLAICGKAVCLCSQHTFFSSIFLVKLEWHICYKHNCVSSQLNDPLLVIPKINILNVPGGLMSDKFVILRGN